MRPVPSQDLLEHEFLQANGSRNCLNQEHQVVILDIRLRRSHPRPMYRHRYQAEQHSLAHLIDYMCPVGRLNIWFFEEGSSDLSRGLNPNSSFSD